MNEITFGDLVKQHRTSKQISINKLSRDTNIDVATIYRIENNEIKKPSFFVVMNIAKELDIDINSITKAFNISYNVRNYKESYIFPEPSEANEDFFTNGLYNINLELLKFKETKEFGLEAVISILSKISEWEKETKKNETKKKDELFYVVIPYEERNFEILEIPILNNRIIDKYLELMNLDKSKCLIFRGISLLADRSNIIDLEDIVERIEDIEGICKAEEFYEYIKDILK